MQTLTFACPHCSRRMGVGMEMLGRPVRCPHCRQVVIAPKTPSPSSTPTVPPAATERRIPQFDAPPEEGAESILSAPGTDDDSVFDSPGATQRVELPNDPRLQQTVPVFRTPDILAAPPLPDSGPTTPSVPISTWQPVPFPTPLTSSSGSMTPSDVSSPWTKLDDSPTGRIQPVVVLSPLPSAPLPNAKAAPPDIAVTDRRRRVVLYALSAYSVVVTILAVWGLLRGTGR